jgi:hypothetical protein
MIARKGKSGQPEQNNHNKIEKNMTAKNRRGKELDCPEQGSQNRMARPGQPLQDC